MAEVKFEGFKNQNTENNVSYEFEYTTFVLLQYAIGHHQPR